MLSGRQLPWVKAAFEAKMEKLRKRLIALRENKENYSTDERAAMTAAYAEAAARAVAMCRHSVNADVVAAILGLKTKLQERRIKE